MLWVCAMRPPSSRLRPFRNPPVTIGFSSDFTFSAVHFPVSNYPGQIAVVSLHCLMVKAGSKSLCKHYSTRFMDGG